MTDNPDDMTPVDVLSAQAAKGQMDPIPAAIEALNQRILVGREARLTLTDRVEGLEAKAPVPGPSGPVGATGTAGTTGAKGATGLTGAAGAAGAKGDVGAQGPAGTPTRIETYTATSNASGIATFTFNSPAFTEILDIRIKPTWNADQYVGGGVTAQTLTGCTVLVKRSRGALLLTSGPFETAPSTAVTIVVYGR